MKILVIRFSSLGDIILTTPVVESLRGSYPDSKIDFLTKKQFSDLVLYNPNISRVINFDSSKNSVFDVAGLIKSFNYDLIVDLHNNLRSFIIRMINFGTKNVVYQKQHLKRKLLTKEVFRSKIKPIKSTINLYDTALKKLQKKLLAVKPKIYLPQNENYIYRKFDFKKADYNIVIAPGAAHYTKQYPVNYYKKLVKLINNDFNVTFILVGDKKDRTLSSKIKEHSQAQIHDLCGSTSILQLAVIIKQADLFISGDSGPMHMAAALNRPQIAIFGSTHPILGFSPVNDKAKIVQTDLSCRPCSIHGLEKCPQKHLNCMNMIKPKEIFNIVKNILKK